VARFNPNTADRSALTALAACHALAKIPATKTTKIPRTPPTSARFRFANFHA